jgi:hypothetical protein
VLVADPETGRGFVYSTDQTAKGRPELLFLDTLGDPNVMISASRIITDYDEAGTVPNNLEVIHKDPFHEGLPLTFIARVIDDDNQLLKRELERLYLHSKSEHGIIVFIPIMMKNRVVTEGGTLWYVLVFGAIVADSTCMLTFVDFYRRCGPILVPTIPTDETLDAWITATARNEADGVRRLHEFLVRQGH